MRNTHIPPMSRSRCHSLSCKTLSMESE
uniref:Uncharacterized protein LOC107624432 isoform X3 n=1 Tax=Rhizophora mucronata TaxID=61149 RepID=A0A2P2IKK7_RHIMU